MAAPQEGYPAQGFPAADPYAQPGYAAEAPTAPPTSQQEHEGGKKKKRGYAAQAYDFGAGANAALGGQTPGGAAFPPAQAPAYGGYPQQAEAQPAYGGAPQFGAPQEVPGVPAPGAPGAPVQPGYGGAAPYGSGVGGYQAPEPGYPGPGAPVAPGAPGAPGAAGVAGITQGMAQMGVGGAQPALPQAAARPAVLNHLYPTDLLTQPFNAAELELPPPPIILPPNVS
jgi:protein transport protein SEC24